MLDHLKEVASGKTAKPIIDGKVIEMSSNLSVQRAGQSQRVWKSPPQSMDW